MPSLLIVPDEWLFYDLKGDNGEERQRETFLFLEKVKDKCDKLVILDRSPLIKKIYKLMKNSYPPVRELSKFFKNNFLLNSEKCKRLNEVEKLAEELKSKIPRKDHYLFQILQSVPGSILITTDEKLCNLSSSLNVSIRLRDEFLKEY